MGMFEGARERIAIWIETRGGQDAIKTFDNIGGAAGRAGQQVEGRFTRAINSGLQKVGIQSKVTGAAIQTGMVAGVAALGTAIAGVVTTGVGKFADLAEKVRDFSRATGLGAEESSRFVAVFDDLQISAEAGGNSLLKMARNAEVNAKAFADQGVAIERTADGNLDVVGTLGNVADAYANTADQGQRANLVMSLLGKTGKDLIPILEQGRAGAEAMFAGVSEGEILNRADLARAEEYRLALDGLDDAVSTFERSLGEDAVPALTEFADALTAAVEVSTSLLDRVGGAGNLLKGFASAIPGVTLLTAGFSHLAKGSLEASKAEREASQQRKESTKAALEEAEALEKATKAVHDNVDATLDAGEAEDKLGTALDKLAEVQARDPNAEIADAAREVADAVLGQEQAANRLSDAQERLNDLKNRDLSLELRRAELAERRARQNAKEAQHTKERAQAELDRLRGDTASTPEQIAKATEDLEDATLGVDEANQSAADSAKAVSDLQNPQTTKEYRDAVIAVKEAQNGVARAADATAEAQKKLNEARRQDKSADITRATRDVQRAMEDVAKGGGTIDQQIAAYQRLLTIVPPAFRGFVNDRIAELRALQYEMGKTSGQIESIFAPIVGTTPPPANPAQPGVGAVIGGIVSGPTAPTPAPTPTGIPDDLNYYGATTPMPRGLASYTDGRTIINIDTVQAHDYEDFRLQMEAERRRNALAS